MTKPVTIPNTFATATTAIPLSNLDADFSTVATALNDANTYSNYAPDTGSANAYVVTLSGVSTTYSAGLRIQFKAGNANTTASTLNVNGGGAKNITYQDATAIASGTIAANSIVDVMYDGTQFLLMNDPAGATGGDVVGPSSATDNAIVRFDGTTGKLVQNSVVTIADSTGDVSGVGQLNATTVDATNIEVTNIKAKDGTAAASIADSTGVISITSNPVLSGGTANGVLYLDGSKVATSGSALTFDGTLFSSTVADNTIGVKFKAATSNLRFVPQDSGVAKIAALNAAESAWYPMAMQGSNLQFVIDTSEQMRLTSTGLGIGTSSPTNNLTVQTSAANGGINVNYSGSTFGLFGIVNPGVSNDTRIGAVSNNSLRFITNNTDRMTLDSSGNLDLATGKVTTSTAGTGAGFQWGGTTVTSRLYDDGSGTVYLDVGAGASNATVPLVIRTKGGSVAFNNGTSQTMTLDASGRLGIGTTSPVTTGGSLFEISNSANCIATITCTNDTTSLLDFRTNGVDRLQIQSSSNWGANFLVRSNQAMLFGTNNTERARITSGGNFKIGGTADRGTTEGDKQLVLFNGTAPVGTLTNGISLYSSSGEAYVMDAAGNATLFSPHDRDTNEWIFRSKHTPSGKVLKIDVERLLRFVNDHFGLDAVQEFIEP